MSAGSELELPSSGEGNGLLAADRRHSGGKSKSRDNSPAPPTLKKDFEYRLVAPASFEAENHYYTRVLNAQIHPTVRFFMGLTKDRLVQRYCHLNPNVDKKALDDVLSYKPKYLRWAGCDLMHTTTDTGKKGMVVIETNTCPSGMKSTPLFDEMEEEGGYATLLRRSFFPTLKLLENEGKVPKGELAVIYDKNPMEASGYAAAMADLSGESVHLVPFKENDKDPNVRFVVTNSDSLPHMEVRNKAGEWVTIRGALRYVTQRPWNRIPVLTTTLIMNPVLACLAGGRNKMVAAKAYDSYNIDLALSGLKIHTPHTIRDVTWEQIPDWIAKLGGHAVIKIPYSNAGQGVYTITSQEEMDEFIEAEKGCRYDKFIVQSLVSNYQWSSDLGGNVGRLFHVGTIPNRKGESFVSDLRLMVSGSEQGFQVVGMYARRARAALADVLTPGVSSWEMLGTNLSVVHGDGVFSTESERLLLMDRKDFNVLGMGIDDLIEAYIQTVLCVVAIDRMSQRLTNEGRFSKLNFKFVNNDDALLSEILDVGAWEPRNVLDWLDHETHN